MARGRGLLRVYLGVAPGVGKTVAMLDEGHRRAGRGTDVVVGFVETHGRKHTADLLDGLDIVPCQEISYRGATFTEMDVHAILARWPAVALVDDLAHTNVPGAGNEKRWQDIQVLLAAGIDVISTVNIQHLESLNDVVEKITGVPQRERDRMRWYARPTRSSWSTWPLRRCVAAWRTATSTPRTRWTRRWGTTSGSATSPRCESSRWCGPLTRSTRGCSCTESRTTSRRPGRPANESWSRWRVDPKATARTLPLERSTHSSTLGRNSSISIGRLIPPAAKPLSRTATYRATV